jgi:hypothetical protein
MSGETRAHWELKRAALYWAQVQGYGIAGVEVRVPKSRYRADVAGYGNVTLRQAQGRLLHPEGARSLARGIENGP